MILQFTVWSLSLASAALLLLSLLVLNRSARRRRRKARESVPGPAVTEEWSRSQLSFGIDGVRAWRSFVISGVSLEEAITHPAIPREGDEYPLARQRLFAAEPKPPEEIGRGLYRVVIPYVQLPAMRLADG